MRAQAKPNDTSTLCSTPGCCNPWIGNYGRRYCAEHAPARRATAQETQRRQAPLPMAMPLRQAVRPYCEPVEREGDAA